MFLLNCARFLTIAMAFCLFGLGNAQAQDLIPERTAAAESEDTKPSAQIVSPDFTKYPDLRIGVDKPVIVDLERDASNIIVGNTDHLAVLPDNSRKLVLIPRQPGATYLQVLDAEGSTIMERHVIIGAVQKKNNYIRIRRSCNGDDPDCKPFSTYYCPDSCHETLGSASQDIQTVSETRTPNSGDRQLILRNDFSGNGFTNSQSGNSEDIGIEDVNNNFVTSPQN
ncbi:MAG: hypothetical protein CMH25_03150 [Micavibrio sp.]|nr:hypothetical protein [Micavibrio sp.]